MSAPQADLFKTSPVQPFGIEIDADLREPLSTAHQQAFAGLLDRHGVLVFRQQSLTHDRQIDLMRSFGPILNASDGIGYISTDTKKGGLGTVELAFHSDLSFTPLPYQAISLHAVDVVDGATSTRFANAMQAYERLPAALKNRLDGLEQLAVMPADQATDRLHDEEIPAGVPQFVRPVIMRHPRSGAPILYVCQQHAARLVGLARAESDALLGELFGYLYAPGTIYEHAWHKGDVVIWDNLSTQHARGSLLHRGPRTLQRVVCAEKSFYELCPQYDPNDPEYLKWLNEADTNKDAPKLSGVGKVY